MSLGWVVGLVMAVLVAYLLWRNTSSFTAKVVGVGAVAMLLVPSEWQSQALPTDGSVLQNVQAPNLQVEANNYFCMLCKQDSQEQDWVLTGRYINGKVSLNSPETLPYALSFTGGQATVAGVERSRGCYQGQLEWSEAFAQAVLDLQFETARSVRLEVGPKAACN